jgi:hypothetical protein
MKSKKNHKNNKNKITLKTDEFLKPKTLWQKRLKSVADHDISLIPTKVDKYILHGGYALIYIKNGKIQILQSVKDPGLKEVYTPRFESIKKLLISLQSKLSNKKFPDIVIPIYAGDNYLWDYNGPYFCYAKPSNKNGLLFPHWNFVNWDKTKLNFEKSCNLPWNERIDEIDNIYFKGDATSKVHSQIREKLAKIYPSIKLSGPFEPPTTMCNYKYVFDLPGRLPWSVRSPILELVGAHPIRFLLYYKKWDENPWVQFYEYKVPYGLHLDINYNKPISDENIEKIKSYVSKFQNKRSLYKSDVADLTEEDIAYYLNYLFTKLQKYNDFFKPLVTKFFSNKNKKKE